MSYLKMNLGLLLWCLVSQAQAQLFQRTYYQSPGINSLALTPVPGSFSMRDDTGAVMAIQGMDGSSGHAFWYRRVATEVCLTGECRPIDVGIYWDGTGDFFGLEVFKEPLTKTDHSNFTELDYARLISILKNDWSGLREYELSELVDEKPEKGVDGLSGATKKEVAEEAVEKAVYTTHTLWHLIHVGEKEQLAQLTAERIKADPKLLKRLLEVDPGKYRLFAMEMTALGRLPVTPELVALLMTALDQRADPALKAMAVNAFPQLDLEQPAVQKQLANILSRRSEPEKIEILGVFKPVKSLTPELYNTLTDDLKADSPWMAARILQIIKENPYQSERTLSVVKALSESNIPVVRKAIEDFRSARKAIPN